jgi:uncharacterized protein YlxW (UPF0749 family)
MGLLRELLRDSGDPGYAQAAERRAAQGKPARRGRADVLIALVALAVVGFLLAAAAVQTRSAIPTVQAQRSELLERIDSGTAATDALQGQVESLRSEVAAAEALALSSSVAGRAAAERLARQQAAAQFTAVTGPGIEVVVEDAKGAASANASRPELGHVLDADLQLVVNGLWAAGAEAVTVNGLRLSSRTAIRAAGGAILVDYRPLSQPYRVDGIGDAATLAARFTAGPAGRALAALHDTYGIRFRVAPADRIAMAAATSSLPVLARPIGGTP